jgi:hypothetical protein
MLDDELRTLISVEPSAEFQARVRSRVSREPIRRGWLTLPLRPLAVAATMAAAAVVIYAAVMARGNPPSSAVLPSERHTAWFVTTSRPVAPELPAIVREAEMRPPRAASVSLVQIDRAESHALRRLFSSPVPILMVDAPKPADDPDLTIPSISIAPLVAETRPEGDRQ